MKYKVKIQALPKAKTGMQVQGSLNSSPNLMGANHSINRTNNISVGKTIGAVPREEANLEAEGGETIMTDLVGMGIPQQYTIKGPRHAQGGVPLDTPDGFIFSDFNQMKIKDREMLNYFGKAAKKGGNVKGYTPADIAKQYDLNKYIGILKNPDSDAVDRKTAELMIKNYNLKLGALGLAQESIKGFEDGVPEISQPYLAQIGATEQDLGADSSDEMMSPEMMMYGGQAGRKLKRRQEGGMPPEMMGQEQMMPEQGMEEGPTEEQMMQEIMPMIEQMIQQGSDANTIAMELISMQVPPELVMQAFIQMGMPEGEAQMAIEAAMSQEQPQEVGQEMMSPDMMQGQGMTPDMMPGMEPSMMQMGGEQEQQMQQMIAEALQQGTSPEEIVQALTQQGYTPEQAQQTVMSIAQQMQQGSPQQMMRYGGDLPKAQVGLQAGLQKFLQAYNEANENENAKGAKAIKAMAELRERERYKAALQKEYIESTPEEERSKEGFAEFVKAKQKQPAAVITPVSNNQVANNQGANTSGSSSGASRTNPSSGYTVATNTDIFGEPALVAKSDLTGVENIQHFKEGEGYGEQVQAIEDFINIHSWFFDTDDKKNKFKESVGKKGEQEIVKEFQKKYNDKLREEGKKRNLSDEQINKEIERIGFSDKGVQKLDGKFGAFTSSRPFWKPADAVITPEGDVLIPDDKKKADDKKDPKTADPIVPYKDPITADWTAPDIFNFRGALKDRMSINSYFPHAGAFRPEFMDAAYLDPSRELAAQAEQANILTQGLGQFAGPQSLSARASSIQGQGAKGAADTLGRYNQQNVGIANNLSAQNTGIANQAQQYNLAKMEDLYNKGVVTQQQRDNAKRQADAAIRGNFAQGWKNASDLAMINATSEQYNVDPLTGTVRFTGVEKPFDPARAEADFRDRVRYWKDEQHLKPDEAVNAAIAETRYGKQQPTFTQKGGFVSGANTYPFW